MEKEFELLTEIQTKVGYTKGKINTVALLGLFGEAGEVINECRVEAENNLPPQPILPNAVRIAAEVDSLKKKIRKNELPAIDILIENEESFDNEMADVLYYLNALAINRGKTLADYAKLSYDKVIRKSQTDITHGTVNQETSK